MLLHAGSHKVISVADLAAAYRGAVERAAKRNTNPRNGGKVHRGETEFPGIGKHARDLGVSRIHLYYVLTGVRRSPRIESWWAKQRRRAG